MIEAFEYRVAQGCKQICGELHAMQGPQAELKSAMFALAIKCQGLAGTTNANNAAIQQVVPALKNSEKCQENMRKQIEGIKGFLDQSVRTIESSYHALETNCVAAINKMAEHHKEQHTAHGECIRSL
jgi:hypothetical protein